MELTLSQPDILNTEFRARDGQVLYRSQTPNKLLSKKVTRLTRGSGEEVGTINYHTIKDDEIVVHGRQITVTGSNMFSL